MNPAESLRLIRERLQFLHELHSAFCPARAEGVGGLTGTKSLLASKPLQGHEVNGMTASSKISVGLLEFGTVRTLGVMGALLAILGNLVNPLYLNMFLPLQEYMLYVVLLYIVLSFVGAILFLVSLEYFSKLYGNPSIYTNYLYFLALYIVAVVVYLLGHAVRELSRERLEDPWVIATQTSLAYPFFLLAYLLYLVAIFFQYRALTLMTAGSQVQLFRYAGLSGLAAGGLLFAGILFLINLIGFLFVSLAYQVLIVSYILLLFAFLEIKEPQPSPSPQPIAPAAPA